MRREEKHEQIPMILPCHDSVFLVAVVPHCVFALTAFVGFKPSERTCSTFLLPFTHYWWTESVTCTGSSLFAVVYAYSERYRKYSVLLPFRLRQTDLNPRQECQ
jgi:hypothetical protein